MADARYETARVADLVRDDGWAPIRRALGVAAFAGAAREDEDLEPIRHRLDDA